MKSGVVTPFGPGRGQPCGRFGLRNSRLQLAALRLNQEFDVLVTEHEPKRRIARQTEDVRTASRSAPDVSQLQRFTLEEGNGRPALGDT